MTRNFKHKDSEIHIIDPRWDASKHVFKRLKIMCPKCKTVVDPELKYPEAGSCQQCGNVYFWDIQTFKQAIGLYSICPC